MIRYCKVAEGVYEAQLGSFLVRRDDGDDAWTRVATIKQSFWTHPAESRWGFSWEGADPKLQGYEEYHPTLSEAKDAIEDIIIQRALAFGPSWRPKNGS